MSTSNSHSQPGKSSDSNHNNACKNKSLLEIIFGTNVSEWEFSENALMKAMDLKIEQEKTKQQYYKLENLNRSIELFKLASTSGLPISQIHKLFNTDHGTAPPSPMKSEGNQLHNNTASARTSEYLPKTNVSLKSLKPLNTNTVSPTPMSRQPSPYKFPPPPSANGLPLPTTTNAQRRANSPARIGASAVAALTENISIKEEDVATRIPLGTRPQESPLNKKPASLHSRNLSLPIGKFTNPNIPSAMTSILSFNRDQQQPHSQTSPQQQQQQPQQQPQDPQASSSHPLLRKPGMVQKKHRRARSTSSFGVIDLSIIDEAKEKHLQRSPSPIRFNTSVTLTPQAQPTEARAKERPTLPQPPREARELRDDLDDRTCSESSSRNESPVRTITKDNSVGKILNST
ncbi:Bop3p [Saccharomyces eubayanus]|uniref:Bop3p n=1 Tax=Saccharomyces eubayanus TaxID=1080349 RepID=UPI0006BF6EC7|nr:BOP3-like protein [Saccharomyces eubayanus]KOG97112.1 BOP3-like protein [Saccharomyces eubayanus]